MKNLGSNNSFTLIEEMSGFSDRELGIESNFHYTTAHAKKHPVVIL